MNRPNNPNNNQEGGENLTMTLNSRLMGKLNNQHGANKLVRNQLSLMQVDGDQLMINQQRLIQVDGDQQQLQQNKPPNGEPAQQLTLGAKVEEIHKVTEEVVIEDEVIEKVATEVVEVIEKAVVATEEEMEEAIEVEEVTERVVIEEEEEIEKVATEVVEVIEKVVEATEEVMEEAIEVEGVIEKEVIEVEEVMEAVIEIIIVEEDLGVAAVLIQPYQLLGVVNNRQQLNQRQMIGEQQALLPKINPKAVDGAQQPQRLNKLKLAPMFLEAGDQKLPLRHHKLLEDGVQIPLLINQLEVTGPLQLRLMLVILGALEVAQLLAGKAVISPMVS